MKHSTELKVKDFLAREIHGKSYNALNDQEVADVTEMVSHLEGVTDQAAIISEREYQELVAKAVYEKGYEELDGLMKSAVDVITVEIMLVVSEDYSLGLYGTSGVNADDYVSDELLMQIGIERKLKPTKKKVERKVYVTNTDNLSGDRLKELKERMLALKEEYGVEMVYTHEIPDHLLEE
ncbi:hypothetical protein [Mammaliicoccus sciuri]|uniref:hypothetical protein n=1 Tax=Mammaliicoccus sciuri TaxID=1296 RepID=UPI003F56A07E